MKRGDTVDYWVPQLVDDNGAPRRAQPQLVPLVAVVLVINADATVDVCVLSERWQSPHIVHSVAQDPTGVSIALSVNRNQCRDRADAITNNTLDSIRDNVKGWVKDRP